MDSFKNKMANSPLLVRVAPFFIFLILTSLQGQFGEASRFWFYLAKTILGPLMLWAIWPRVTEMRWRISIEAIVVGLAIFAIWVGLDGLYPRIGKMDVGWNPHQQFGNGSTLA